MNRKLRHHKIHKKDTYDNNICVIPLTDGQHLRYWDKLPNPFQHYLLQSQQCYSMLLFQIDWKILTSLYRYDKRLFTYLKCLMHVINILIIFWSQFSVLKKKECALTEWFCYFDMLKMKVDWVVLLQRYNFNTYISFWP